jgi:hypothetical protein
MEARSEKAAAEYGRRRLRSRQQLYLDSEMHFIGM